MTLTPGSLLRLTRNAVGLGDEPLDVTLLQSGSIVRYIAPSWVRVALESGEEVDVHISALEPFHSKI